MEFDDLRTGFQEKNLFKSVVPYFYKTADNNMGLRVATAFILRELYKNNSTYINFFLQDEKSLSSIKDFLIDNDQ